MSKMSKSGTIGGIIFLVICIIIFLLAIFSDMGFGDIEGSNKRTYDCDYHTLSFKTKITTTINNEEVSITGDLFTFFTDPLQMTNSQGKVIATADDSYHLISQDDHNIVVNGKFEICVAGNVDLLGETYDLYNSNKQKVGYAKFGAMNCSGAIYDNNDKMIAKFSSPIIFNDYTVTIVDNNICSDTAILLIMASYVSDYQADNA